MTTFVFYGLMCITRKDTYIACEEFCGKMAAHDPNVGWICPDCYINPKEEEGPMTHQDDLNDLGNILGLPIKDIRIQKHKVSGDSDFFFTVNNKQVKLTVNQICVRSAFRKAIFINTLLLPKRFSLSGWDEVVRLILKIGTSVVESYGFE